jgi:glucose-1-phosphate thymidylyltransferase
MPTDDVVGLIPCGGHATRIAPLPCSKELFPVGLHQAPDGSLRPKVVSHFLLEKMQRGGVGKVFFILRNGKWDIPQYYGDGSTIGMDVGYLIMGRPHGPPYTLDQAYPFIRNSRVAFGFPDILFQPDDAYERALKRLNSTRAAIVLGLYPAQEKWTWHAVEADRTGRVRRIFMKSTQTKSELGWVFAVWSSKFTEFLHRYLAMPRPDCALNTELTVGETIAAAIRAGLRTQSVIFPYPNYLDIGTPADLQRVASAEWSK